jgi:hypothetical protein
MNMSKRKAVYTLCAILLLLVSGNAFGSDDPSDLLPAGLVMEDVFKPGPGGPVGKVEAVEGEVVIIHAGELIGYKAKKDLPLFTGDTIVTLETGRIRFKLNDESILRLSSETKLVINRSVFDPAKESRSSYFGMSSGKARFWVSKFTDFKRSMFNVKTPTAVCGVRGSDFINFVTASSTEITSLEKTVLEVRNLAFPEKKPLIIKDDIYCSKCGFERAIVKEGTLRKIRVSPNKVEEMKKLFEMTPEKIEDDATLEETEELSLDIVEEVHQDIMREWPVK